MVGISPTDIGSRLQTPLHDFLSSSTTILGLESISFATSSEERGNMMLLGCGIEVATSEKLELQRQPKGHCGTRKCARSIVLTTFL